MSRSTIYEAVAVSLGLCGAIVFGFGIFPHVNPVQFKLSFGPKYYAASIACITVSIVMMGSGLLLSLKAQSMNPSHAFSPFTCGRVDYSRVEFGSRPATRLILWSLFQATSTATESWM